MKDLKIKRKDGFEYAFGMVSKYPSGNAKPILLKCEDQWMTLVRAKKIHEWLGKAIEEAERAK